MKVHFKRGWFGPDAARYRKSETKFDYREVPDEFRAALPKTATVIENPEAPPVAAKETLRDHDVERAGQDEAQAKIADADKQEFARAMQARNKRR